MHQEGLHTSLPHSTLCSGADTPTLELPFGPRSHSPGYSSFYLETCGAPNSHLELFGMHARDSHRSSCLPLLLICLTLVRAQEKFWKHCVWPKNDLATTKTMTSNGQSHWLGRFGNSGLAISGFSLLFVCNVAAMEWECWMCWLRRFQLLYLFRNISSLYT